MDEKVLRVGTIIGIDESLFMISGYRLVEEEGMTGLAYIILPYPLGYVGVDSVALVSAANEYKVVSVGYGDDESRSFIAMLEEARMEGRDTPFEAYAEAIRQRYDDVVVGKDEDE